MSGADETRTTRPGTRPELHAARSEPALVAFGPRSTLLALCLAALLPLPAAGQEGSGSETPESGPRMADAPAQFRVGAAAGVLGWPDGADRSPDDGGLFGLDLERLLLPAVAIRFGASYGTTTLPSPDDAVAADAYLVELSGVVRAAVGPFRRTGVVPFGTLGVGSLVHDPDREGLGTVSQNALTWGAGLEARPLATVDASPLAALGLRAEWRRYQVELENALDPVDRSGRTRRGDRFFVTLFWAF